MTVMALAFNVRVPVTLIFPTEVEDPPVAVNKANAPEFKVVAPPMVRVPVVALASVALEEIVTAEEPIEPPLPKASVPALTVVAPL